MSPIRVLYITTGLGAGGAEMMLSRLLARTDRDRFEPLVLSLLPFNGEPIAEEIAAAGIPLRTLGLRPGRVTTAALARLGDYTREFDPDVISGWQVHGNLAAWLASRIVRRDTAVLWNVRGSLDDPSSEKLRTRMAIRLMAHLSSGIDAIVYNSHRAALQHGDSGYDRECEYVIPNGFDCDRFRPDDDARDEVRRHLGLPLGAILAGMIARYHPVKDHRTLLASLRHVHDQGQILHLALAGENITPANTELVSLVQSFGLASYVSLLGRRQDTERLNAAFDFACLSSLAEGFPNVIGEAMATGLPCVATDTGDTAELLRGCGIVVAPAEPVALGGAMVTMSRLTPDRRRMLGMRARTRIRNDYSLGRIAARFDELHAALAGPLGRADLRRRTA